MSDLAILIVAFEERADELRRRLGEYPNLGGQSITGTLCQMRIEIKQWLQLPINSAFRAKLQALDQELAELRDEAYLASMRHGPQHPRL